MYTYKHLRSYNLTILKNMLDNEYLYREVEDKKGNWEHVRETDKCIEKIKKVIDEKERGM